MARERGHDLRARSARTTGPPRRPPSAAAAVPRSPDGLEVHRRTIDKHVPRRTASTGSSIRSAKSSDASAFAVAAGDRRFPATSPARARRRSTRDGRRRHHRRRNDQRSPLRAGRPARDPPHRDRFGDDLLARRVRFDARRHSFRRVLAECGSILPCGARPASMRSAPAMAASSSAASTTSARRTIRISRYQQVRMTPVHGTSPNIGFIPRRRPVQTAGIRVRPAIIGSERGGSHATSNRRRRPALDQPGVRVPLGSYGLRALAHVACRPLTAIGQSRCPRSCRARSRRAAPPRLRWHHGARLRKIRPLHVRRGRRQPVHVVNGFRETSAVERLSHVRAACGVGALSPQRSPSPTASIAHATWSVRTTTLERASGDLGRASSDCCASHHVIARSCLSRRSLTTRAHADRGHRRTGGEGGELASASAPGRLTRSGIAASSSARPTWRLHYPHLFAIQTMAPARRRRHPSSCSSAWSPQAR